MKAIKLALAISLAVNLALCWKLSNMPQPVTPTTSPLMDTSWEEPAAMDTGLRVPSLLAPPGGWTAGPALQPAAMTLNPAGHPLPLPSQQPPPPPGDLLPPNPHAMPAWEKRLPYHESQIRRGLYQNPPPKDEPGLK